jgi:hypothetical protein
MIGDFRSETPPPSLLLLQRNSACEDKRRRRGPAEFVRSLSFVQTLRSNSRIDVALCGLYAYSSLRLELNEKS